MARLQLVIGVGREYLRQNPAATDEEIRAHLNQEFTVDRDIEITLLRSAGFVALLVVGLMRLFRASPQARATKVLEQIEEAISQLRQ